MFSKSLVINDVYLFDVDGSSIAHLDFAGFSKETLFLDNEKIASPPIGGFKLLSQKKLVFEQTDIGTFIIDTAEIAKPKLLTTYNSIPSSYTGDKIIIKGKGRDLGKWNILNLKTNEINSCPLKGLIKGKFIIKREKNKSVIKVFDYHDEKECINFSLTDYDVFRERENKPQISKVNIFQDQYLILSIDESTMAIMDILKNELLNIFEVNTKESGIGFTLAQGNWGMYIFSIYHEGMWLLNIITGEIKFINLDNEFNEHGIIPYSYGDLHCIENFTIFSAFNTKTGTVPCSLVALNLTTHKITWVHEFDTEETGMSIYQPIILNKTLYVRSQNNNLHVFKYEN